MVRLRDDQIASVAEDIRPHITPFLEDKGHVTNEELRELIARHGRHDLRSDRSLDMVQEALCEL